MAARWNNFNELRQTSATADTVTLDHGNRITVFNIGGNNYRLLTHVCFGKPSVFIKEFLTHAEYDTDAWKERLDYVL